MTCKTAPTNLDGAGVACPTEVEAVRRWVEGQYRPHHCSIDRRWCGAMAAHLPSNMCWGIAASIGYLVDFLKDEEISCFIDFIDGYGVQVLIVPLPHRKLVETRHVFHLEDPNFFILLREAIDTHLYLRQWNDS